MKEPSSPIPVVKLVLLRVFTLCACIVCSAQVCCNLYLCIHAHVQRYINNGAHYCALFYLQSVNKRHCLHGYKYFNLSPISAEISTAGTFCYTHDTELDKIQQKVQIKLILRTVLAQSKDCKDGVCTLY